MFNSILPVKYAIKILYGGETPIYEYTCTKLKKNVHFNCKEFLGIPVTTNVKSFSSVLAVRKKKSKCSSMKININKYSVYGNSQFKK